MRDTAVAEVYSAASATEAHVLKKALEATGIEARVVGDALQSNMGYPPWEVITPRVWVRASDEPRARELVAKWLAQRAVAGNHGGPWVCVVCSEAVDGAFETCWHCGATRDGLADPQFQREETEHEVLPGHNVWSPFQYSLMALVVVITFFAVLFALLKL